MGQYRYEQQKKLKKSRKNVRGHVTKEIKLSPRISDHDFMVRLKRGQSFIQKGHALKVSVYFRARMITRPEIGRAVLERYIQEIADIGSPVGVIAQAHRSLYININPK